MLLVKLGDNIVISVSKKKTRRVQWNFKYLQKLKRHIYYASL